MSLWAPATELTLEAVLRTQAGVIRARDVSAWLSLADVRAEVADGRWQMPYYAVYVTHNGALTREQELRVCLLAAAEGSALSGLTAAELDGFEGFSAPEVHVTVPAGSRKPHRDGLEVHYSHHLDAVDVHPVKNPRRTRIARSLVDAASWETTQRRSRAIILAGVQQRRVRPDDLRDALGRRGPCKGHALIAESIDDAEGGIASVPEREFEQVRRRFGLPTPTHQAVARRRGGRYYLDVDWDEFGVATEVHGTQHLTIPNWDADLDRHNELTARGRRILQFSSYSVRHRQDEVGRLVARALRYAGWRS